MPLPIRPVAVKSAVLIFFLVGVVGMIRGLSPETCCYRALMAAVGAYVVACIAVRIINGQLTQAMVDSWVQSSEETSGDESA